MNTWGFLVFIVQFSTVFAEIKKNDPCTNPNGNIGTCIPASECQIVYNMLTSRNYTILKFVRESYCGYDNEALVCCESPSAVDRNNYDKTMFRSKATCGIPREQLRIVGGEITEIGEFPWVIAIEYADKETGKNAGIRCAATLINDEYAITAAYCLLDKEYEISNLRLGEWKLSTDPDCVELVANDYCADPVQNIKPRELIPHPLYSKKYGYYDIGLIRFNTKVKFTNFIRPICLPSADMLDPEPGKRMTVAGWGATLNSSSSDVLIKVDVPIVLKEECKKKLENVNRHITSRQLCAGGEAEKDACRGDGGGALMRIYSGNGNNSPNWIQYGIVSWGVGCARAGYPAVYTRVVDYLDWVVNVILVG